jgi:hypothetical protein
VVLEPADKPVRFYENVLFVLSQLLWIASDYTGVLAVELVGAGVVAILTAVSVWKLLVPPRLSTTRGAYVVAGLVDGFLLFNQWAFRPTHH